MKNIKYLLVFILGVILTMGISNAYILNANDVTYDKKNTTLESENIQGALDELGVLANTLTDTSDAKASETDILSGKTAYVNGEKITGTYEEKGDTQVYTGSKRWSGSSNKEIHVTETVNIGKNKTLVGVYYSNYLDFGSTVTGDVGSNNCGRYQIYGSYDSDTGIVTIDFYFVMYTSHVTVSGLVLPYVIIYY